jgi:hypothetical protein
MPELIDFDGPIEDDGSLTIFVALPERGAAPAGWRRRDGPRP